MPVVACVETYKFGERVALDGVATNEIGQGAELLDSHSPMTGGAAKAGNNLTPLTLMYDLTPPALITAVCTEVSTSTRAVCEGMFECRADPSDRLYPAIIRPHRVGQDQRSGITNICRCITHNHMSLT